MADGQQDIVLRFSKRLAGKAAPERIAAGAGEPGANFRLEQHDERNGGVGEEIGDEPFAHFKTRALRGEIEREDEADGYQHLRGAGSAQQIEHVIDDDGDEQDIGNGAGVEPLENARPAPLGRGSHLVRTLA